MKKIYFAEHLTELRFRVLGVLLFFFVAFCLCYYFSEEIYHFLLDPLQEVAKNNEDFSLIYTGLTEAFFVYLRVAFLAALLISAPFFLWQTYAFIAPGLYKAEKQFLGFYLLATPLLFALGAAVVYYYIFPLAWSFFIHFESDGNGGLPISFMPSVSEYLDIVVQLMLAFGAAFQLPVVLTLTVRVGLITPESLVKKRRLAIVVIFIVAAFLTPPDVFSQIGLALPMILLYELSVVACRYMGKK